MARALAEHSSETLLRYARKAFVESAAYFKGSPSDAALATLNRAAKAMKLATYADPRSSHAPVATEINEVIRELNGYGWPCKL